MNKKIHLLNLLILNVCLYKLILDFDGFAMSIKARDYLTVTDGLHSIISDEYERTIKEPVKQYMRGAKE